MRGGTLVAFSPPLKGSTLPAWHSKRNILAIIISDTIGTKCTVKILRSSNPEYLIGTSHAKCVRLMEEVFEESGRIYRDTAEAPEITFETQ